MQPGFLIRAIFYFVIWNLLSFLLSKWSKEGDQPNAPDNTNKFISIHHPVCPCVHSFSTFHLACQSSDSCEFDFASNSGSKARISDF